MKGRKQGKLRSIKPSGPGFDTQPPVVEPKSLSKESCTPEAEWQWAHLHQELRNLIRAERK